MGAKILFDKSRVYKVLAIDDEEEILSVYRMFLSQQGFQVTAVDTSEKMMDYLVYNRPDIVLLDVNMPKVNGLMVLEMLREDEKYEKIPIIMISARRDVDTITKAAKLGCDNFIIKPFKLSELARRINIELFSVDMPFMQSSFEKIDEMNNNLLQQEGLNNISPSHFDTYPFKYEGTEFALVVVRGLKKSALLKMSEEEVHEKTRMFFKMPSNVWRKVFPR